MCSVWGVHDGAVCPTASQEKSEEREEREAKERREEAINKRERERARSERSEQRKTENNSGAIAPCVAVSEAFKWRRSAASVGNVQTNGITPALVSP